MAFVGARKTRVLMASLALLCLACQATTFAHLLLVTHAACAEHGELIDARSDASVVTVPATPIADAALLATAGAPQSHTHDHCAVVATRRDDVRENQPAVLLINRAGPDQPSRPVAEVPAAAIRLLDIAPKSSPPV